MVKRRKVLLSSLQIVIITILLILTMMILLFNNSNYSNDIKDNDAMLDDINRIQSHKNVIVNENSNIDINARSSIHTTTSTTTTNRIIDLSKLNSNEIAILQYDSRPLSDYWYYTLLSSLLFTHHLYLY